MNIKYKDLIVNLTNVVMIENHTTLARSSLD